MPLSLSAAAEIVTLGGTIFACIGFLTRWMWRGYRTATSTLGRIEGSLTSLTGDMATVKQEVTINGGRSLKDRVTVIGQDVQRLHHELKVSTAARRVGDNRAIFEMVVVDGEARPRYVSREWTRLTGLTREDMDDGGWLSCIQIADQPRILAMAQEANENQSIFQAEYWCVNAMTGAPHYIRHIGHPIFSDAGVLVGWVGEIIVLQEPE